MKSRQFYHICMPVPPLPILRLLAIQSTFINIPKRSLSYIGLHTCGFYQFGGPALLLSTSQLLAVRSILVGTSNGEMSYNGMRCCQNLYGWDQWGRLYSIPSNIKFFPWAPKLSRVAHSAATLKADSDFIERPLIRTLTIHDDDDRILEVYTSEI